MAAVGNACVHTFSWRYRKQLTGPLQVILIYLHTFTILKNYCAIPNLLVGPPKRVLGLEYIYVLFYLCLLLFRNSNMRKRRSSNSTNVMKHYVKEYGRAA